MSAGEIVGKRRLEAERASIDGWREGEAMCVQRLPWKRDRGRAAHPVSRSAVRRRADAHAGAPCIRI
jgi:hypothetical protein